MEIWRGRVLWRGYVHPYTHPHTQSKKSGIFHTHIQSMRGFPSKWGRVRAKPTRWVYLPSLLNSLFLFNLVPILFNMNQFCPSPN